MKLTSAGVRKSIATAALAVMLALLVTALVTAPPFHSTSRWILVLPLVISIAGILTARAWGRWLGLAIAVAVLPWTLVLSLDPTLPSIRGFTTLACVLALFATLSGQTMILHFEGRQTAIDWTGPRMRWLRWAIICNLASVLALLLFVLLYDAAFDWHLPVFTALIAGLVTGTLLLARQLTAGLLLVWLCALAILPVLALFIRAAGADPAENILLVANLAPGIITGWATAFVFGRPLWRFLRSA